LVTIIEAERPLFVTDSAVRGYLAEARWLCQFYCGIKESFEFNAEFGLVGAFGSSSGEISNAASKLF
jgi:hypothetical protein